jgi:hypothetical protein
MTTSEEKEKIIDDLFEVLKLQKDCLETIINAEKKVLEKYSKFKIRPGGEFWIDYFPDYDLSRLTTSLISHTLEKRLDNVKKILSWGKNINRFKN